MGTGITRVVTRWQCYIERRHNSLGRAKVGEPVMRLCNRDWNCWNHGDSREEFTVGE